MRKIYQAADYQMPCGWFYNLLLQNTLHRTQKHSTCTIIFI